MPLVRISLLKGKSPEYLRAIADGVHQALHEAFSAPADDRFQLIDEYEPGRLIYDPDYLGVRRDDDVVFVTITHSNWRDTRAKRALYRRVVELLAKTPGIRPENVQIILSSNRQEDWSFGNGLASYVKD